MIYRNTMNDKICRVRMRSHSGMDAGIQRPRMANFGFLQATNNVKVSPPCDWIPAIPAGMTCYRLLYVIALACAA